MSMTEAVVPPQTTGETVIDIQGLTKRYGNFTALDNLTLRVAAGQILGLIGPNGAGKTTAIKILVGLVRPTAGSARIAGVDCVADSRRIKHLVGYMRDKFVESLSHGMQQRVGIARTLLHDPRVLILDEPANGLDPQARVEMRDLLIKLAASGKTLLVTSHILTELSRICQRMAILTHGKLRAFGTVEEIGRQVSQQRTIELQLVAADQVAAAAQIVRAEIEAGAEVTEAATEGAVRFRTMMREADLSRLLEKLVTGGIHVAQYRELQTDLEEAFMSFARPDSAAATGGR